MISPLFLPLIALVAAVYASVGHGGASGYLAIMALLAYEPQVMSSTALILNVLVSGIAVGMFWRAGHGSARMAWPLLAASIPAAFLGGWLPVSTLLYGRLLAIVLLLAALRLCLPDLRDREADPRVPVPWLLGVGGGLGWLSSIVGVGGGIFLSPLMVLFGWAGLKRTAAISAVFILLNSLAGLIGRCVAGRLVVGSPAFCVAAALASLAGGLCGSWLGAHRLPSVWLRRLLAGVLAIAAGKLVMVHG